MRKEHELLLLLDKNYLLVIAPEVVESETSDGSSARGQFRKLSAYLGQQFVILIELGFRQLRSYCGR